ncbi:hypothetical protein [Pseudoneobacillus rhizosphaerae]|uniref:Uncharacterized protein n=1 Tax=Pseudoneobacillus rhizosphaerae TaxID=2880968 RepID=A0A9C7L943_9BACI|nr:hypothetical protein [Pseudoneobacillus rhizosphaerae]CAG9606537.1 hypothetical protein NEOCIP111885_00225 [Pseudoneobacillus rhizosphaerae]
MDSFTKGYEFFAKNASSFAGSHGGIEYISSINKEIEKLQSDINQFQGFQTKSSILQGDVAEFWHSGTHNIDAAIKGKAIRTTVDRSHHFASADVTDNNGNAYGMKYYQTGSGSAKAQAESLFERYSQYKANAIKADRPFQSVEQFINERGYDEAQLLNDPIYAGQVRVIPKDQMQEAIHWLERKIAKESINRPDQVQRYEDTLKMLKDKIETSEGTESIPFTREESEILARLAKEGEFDAGEYGLTTEQLVKYKYVMEQAFKAGLTAATISIVLKAGPEIYKAIDYLIKTGELDERQFQKIGFAALEGGAEGFVRGSISAALTAACKSGLAGEALKSVNPAVIGVVTVLVLDVMKNSYLVANGKMTNGELIDSLVRGMYVSACSLILGGITQSLITIPVFGFMLGSFIGSTIGSFAYSASYKAYISFCIDSGFTMFGIVGQDYQLPKDLLDEIGLSTFDYEKMQLETFEIAAFEVDIFEFEHFSYETLGITFLRRGVIGVNQIGYV